MTRHLAQMDPVYVAGVGLHRFGPASQTPYVQLGLTAVRSALADAEVDWPDVQSTYTGTAMLGMAVSRPMLRHLGVSGAPMTQVENASASGSSAFRLACLEVASGISDIALAVGVDKPARVRNARTIAGTPELSAHRVEPVTHYALLAEQYMNDFGVTAEEVAAVAAKNFSNAALNPNAHRQTAYSVDEILSARRISGVLTKLQCCPVGEGGAAVVVVSDSAIDRMGLDRSRCVRVVASVQRSEQLYGAKSFDAELTRETANIAFEQSGIGPSDLDLVELHDAFSIEELQYLEAMGIAGEGLAAKELAAGAFNRGGRVAVNTSGGLLGSGHPVGPTGIAQIAELTTQIRGDAGPRQHPGARTGLAHMVGLGAVCAVHILQGSQSPC
ncbi:thiolase family protein [Gordonia sp. CPCC 205515]|uniref:thiolase family protein n=1 Tax=Gordonia sp. CPCC 205515 TaxID=3140791 RepID=UPI003AF33B49